MSRPDQEFPAIESYDVINKPSPRPKSSQPVVREGAPFNGIVLDEHDPFELALIDIVQMNRRKRADYAADGDPFSNFETSSELLGMSNFGVTEAILFNIAQKLSRIKSLRMNGRMEKTRNETVVDTYLDLAVYGAILYAWVKKGLSGG